MYGILFPNKQFKIFELLKIKLLALKNSKLNFGKISKLDHSEAPKPSIKILGELLFSIFIPPTAVKYWVYRLRIVSICKLVNWVWYDRRYY